MHAYLKMRKRSRGERDYYDAHNKTDIQGAVIKHAGDLSTGHQIYTNPDSLRRGFQVAPLECPAGTFLAVTLA